MCVKHQPKGWENETSPADALHSRPLARSVRGAQIRIPLRAMPVPSGYPVVVPKRRADCEASPWLAHYLPRPSPSSPTTPPSEPDRVTVARPRCSTDNPVPALLVPAQAKLLSEPTPTRTTPPPLPHPGASRPTPNQHHPRKKEPSATSTAVRASPVRFACQSKYRGQHAPRYHLGADSTARFECLCIQWRQRTMDAGIPPLLTSDIF